MGFNPLAMECRTTRSMWPSSTSVSGRAKSSVTRTKRRGSRPPSLTARTWEGDIVPPRSVAKHGAHPLAHASDAILQPRALVVVIDAAGRVGMERAPEVERRVMAADHLAQPPGCGNLLHHLLGVGHYPGVVHYFTQPNPPAT